MPSDRWSDTDRELVARTWYLSETPAKDDVPPAYTETGRRYRDHAAAVLDALTAAGWEPRCDCDGVVHNLPILRSHIRGEPGCRAAVDAGRLPESSDEGSTDA